MLLRHRATGPASLVARRLCLLGLVCLSLSAACTAGGPAATATLAGSPPLSAPAGTAEATPENAAGGIVQALATAVIGELQGADGPPQSTLPPAEPEASPTPLTPEPITDLKSALAQRTGEPAWQTLGLPTTLAKAAEAFVTSGQALSPADAADLQAVLEQWNMLESLAARRIVPAGAQVDYRVFMYRQPGGEQHPVLYAVGPQARAYLIIHDRDGAALGLVLSPPIGDFQQAPSLNGQFIEYLDSRGRTVIYADARILESAQVAEKTLLEKLQTIYGAQDDYVQAGVFPRFLIAVDGIEAGLYGVDRSLTQPQVLLLREAFLVFTRPEFQPMEAGMFGPGVAIVVMDRVQDAAGLTYSGTGVIVLDRRDLFGNKYQLAQVLAHEASHVLQGDIRGDDVCTQLLHREVGDQSVPADLLSWDAGRLMQAVRDSQIGAYHVSLWMLYRQGVRDLDWLYRVITTGTANGKSLLIGCDNKK
jgi:hypothetical protein